MWPTGVFFFQMALRGLSRLSSLLRSAVVLTLRRNVGISAVVFNKAKELDPVQKLFLDKIRDYNNKSKLVHQLFSFYPLERTSNVLRLKAQLCWNLKCEWKTNKSYFLRAHYEVRLLLNRLNTKSDLIFCKKCKIV